MRNGQHPATAHLPLDDIRPHALSRELRQDQGGFLSNRRGILAWSLTAAGAMAAISLYQMGLIRHLPEPSVRYLDADKVDASDESYAWFSSPDAPLGLVSYAATGLLSAIGGRDRAQRRPWIPLALAAKAGVDSVAAAKLTVDQWTKHRAFCSWCLLAAGATFTYTALTFAEARAALRTLRGE